jgi:GAF domain-containing protein
LYALGVLLFRMATGKEPFSGTATAILVKHVGEPPPRPTSPAGPIPDWLERLILRLLEKDPARRLQSAEEVVQWFDRSRSKVAAPADESGRLDALRSLKILDTDAEQAFDDLTSLASYICGTPLAAISLVDEDRQWFKSKVGMSTSETSRNIAFCAHTILGHELFMVSDATQDARFCESPLVTSNPQVRFYAGLPLATSDGHNVGALCVMDRKPRQLNADQIAALASISRLVQSQLEMRRDLAVLREAVGK